MRNIIFSFFTSLFLFFVPFNANAFNDMQVAFVRIMNKAAGKAQTVQIPVGKTVEFEKLRISIKTCKQTDPFKAEDFFIFTEIFDANNNQIFGGWMSRNEPGNNPLQNPDYDLWLVKCE